MITITNIRNVNYKAYDETWAVVRSLKNPGNINLGIMCEEDCAYIDIDKNDKEMILSWLEENDIAVPTGDVSDDGYPEYRFNPEVLRCVCVEILEEEIAR